MRLWHVKTAFDVAMPSVVSHLPFQKKTLTVTHGHIVAALLEEMKDLKGSACFGDWPSKGNTTTNTFSEV